MLDGKLINDMVNTAWSDYCDLDYWIDDMTSGKPNRIPKNVLKMAMKHLRSDMYKIHKVLCAIQSEFEVKDE